HKGKMKGKYIDLQKKILKNEELSLIYSKYQEELRKQKVYDFEDMIIEVLRTLKKEKDLLLTLQEKYQYVLVDEHQDTNNAQNKILEMLLNFHDNPNIFVVGDEKQAIFRFQGASLENFYYFKHLYPKAVLINLEENYRSTQRILDLAYDVQKKDQKLKASLRKDDHAIEVAALPDTSKEMKYVADSIKNKKGEIAVLYRDNKDAYDLIPFLESENIPYVIESDTSIFEEPIIKKTLILFEAIWNFGDDLLLSKVLHLDFFGIRSLDIFKIIRSADRKRKKLLADIITSEKEIKDLGVEDVDKALSLGEKLSSWSKKARNEDLIKLSSEILHDSGIIKEAAGEDVDQSLSAIEILYEEIKKVASTEGNLGDFLDYVKSVMEHNILIKKRKSTTSPDKVRLMTVHRSKGLEFDHVFLIHASDKHFGGRSGRKRREKLPLLPRVYRLLDKEVGDDGDDDRNLFYVALTRARETITITYPKEVLGREVLPTVYIEDLRDDLVSRIDIDVEVEKIPKITRKEKSISKEFVRELFIKQGLSVTALNNYLKSPWQYFYQNLIRIPQVPNKHQSYGTAIHRSLKELFEGLKKGEDVGKEELMLIFHKNLESEWFIDHDEDEARVKGDKALSAWFEEYSDRWNTNTLNEFRISGVILSDEIRLVGVLDKLEFLSETEVNVVDYKTGKPKTRNQILGKTKDSNGDYFRQLIFYKILLENSKYDFVEGEIDFIEPDSRGLMHKEKFTVSDEDVLDLKKQIIEVSGEIMDLKFLDTPCDPEKCSYCDLVDLI
ncbi:MAG: ATP-dependent helicase, partial [Candidatus Pacebacteria bacterium]|nr:ATP-dependent helicase [Candidatus Paceibacterota bacterium]